MVKTDRFDLPVTSASAQGIGDYVAAVDLLLSANIGAAELLERALAADPEFALAHIANARLLQLQARIPEARQAAARAKALCRRVSAREQRHIDAVALAVEGASTEAMAMVRTHVSEYPRDALPLSLALGVFGLLGFSGRLDHHEAQLALLEELAPHWDDDWWFLGYLGWAYIETGEVTLGTGLVERSLARNPRNAHAAHQRVHGFFESGDAAGGAAFIEPWLRDYDRAGHLHCHLSWHLALFELARGNSERARAIYLDSIRPAVAQTAPMLSLADSASFLWRWQLYGVDTPLDEQWSEVAAHARRHFPRAKLAFADLHAAFAEAATGNEEVLQGRIDGLDSLAEGGRLPPGKVAPALCSGAAALARGENFEAAQMLEAALADLPRIGGSHAQREVFEDTLIVAYLRSGQTAKAAPLLRSRLARRPSARDETWLARCTTTAIELSKPPRIHHARRELPCPTADAGMHGNKTVGTYPRATLTLDQTAGTKKEEAMAQSQPSAAREQVRNIVPGLIDLSERVLFGEVWERPGLSKRDRSLITCATLIALGREKQLVGHLQRALDNGLTKNELGEVITHLAFYAGWPAAMTAALVAKDVFEKK